MSAKACNTEHQPLVDYINENDMYRQAAGADLFFITIPFDGAVQILNPGITVGYGKDHVYEFLLPKKAMMDIAEEVVKGIVSEETTINVLREPWQQRWSAHDTWLNHFWETPIDGSLQDILDHLNEYTTALRPMWDIAYYTDCFDPHGEEILEREVFGQIENLPADGRSALLRHHEPTTLERFELTLLIGVQEKTDEATLAKKLQEEFHWMNNDYASGTPLPIKHFIQKIREAQQQWNDSDRAARIDELRRYTENVLREKDALCEQYGIDGRQKGILYALAELTDWREERKRKTQQSDFVHQQFVNVLSKKTGIPKEHIAYADSKERALLESSEDAAVELKRRADSGVVYAIDTKHDELYLFSEPDSVALVKDAITTSQVGDSAELTGMVAQPGIVSGIVKIINSPKEFGKFEEGDILVSAMTRPELMPVIKKAAGIITDEGGITCHAAIVSRELKIPCVIGTQKATMLLQDGDTVTLNAEEGRVEKVS